MRFYIGLHIISHAHEFEYCMLSIANPKLRERKSDLPVNNWIMDSGAFTEISTYGHYRFGVDEYANHINRWSRCGNLEMAVAQDYMCEDVMLKKTGLTIAEHQRLTIERYDALIGLTTTPIMPVLQGYQIGDYLRHIHQYATRLKPGMRVGIGSVCKRNKDVKQIEDILFALMSERNDLLYHGFGLKRTALASDAVNALLFSSDSMAWSFAARRQGQDANSPLEAHKYCELIEKSPRQLNMLVNILSRKERPIPPSTKV
jgi:hypothetical protein